MSVEPRFYTSDELEFSFATTSAVAIAKYQEVSFGADDDTVTGTTTANTGIGISMETVAAGDAGATKRIKVRLHGSKVIPMIGNGTVTRGLVAVATGVAGKVTDTGATPDARTVKGRFLASNAVDGNYVPVLVQ